MADTTRKLPRAPRVWWESILFVTAIFLPMTIYPFVSAVSSTVTPLGTSLAVAGVAIALLRLSIFRDVGPTFVEKAEADFQNRHAKDAYTIPVYFDVRPIFASQSNSGGQ